MSSVLLKRCTACKEYTLQEACPRCGAQAKPNRPAKFSPEDNYGEYRRKLKKLDAAKGAGNSSSERAPSTPARATESTESRETAGRAAGSTASRGSVDSVARPKSKGA